MSDLKRLEDLFQAAADLDPAERAAFLDREAEQPKLRQKLEAMLEDLDSGHTLERPTPVADARQSGGPSVGRDSGEARSDGRNLSSSPFEASDPLVPGTSIGRYRLLELVGEGGFGRVYRAEQQEPVRRRVALKVIKVGMDSREVVARFEAERQALALMDHPSIAKVLDGGMTDEGPHPGRPYFVMELVRGLPITDYCRSEGLGLRARIELFLDVCAAVQHAHQKGVIHRDLKPSNVLVTIQDGKAVPKVIDFGVAKAMHGRLTDKTLFTSFHHFIGTPAYMSPEQAEMSALDIDTRSDVYSLGVLLYELLTGSTPFSAETLARAGLPEIQRILREERPPRPSTRVDSSVQTFVHSKSAENSDPSLTPPASAPGLEPSELSKRLRGDLDWIVMKALEKERGRRYGTASELADDLRRHLAREPVLAGPPSRSYRLGKFLSRHRAAVVSVSLLVLALVGGTVGTSIGLYEASRQRDTARREAERARSVTEFLIGTLSLADIEEALDPELSVRRLLDRAAAQAENVLGDQPVAEARVRSTLGRAYQSLNENALAERQLRRALELSDQVREESGSEPPATLHRGGALEGLELYDTLWALTHVLFKIERPDAQTVAQRSRVVAHAIVRDRDPELADQLDSFIEIIRSGVHTPDSEPVERAIEVLNRAMARAEARIPSGDPLWPVLADSCMDGAYTLWYTPHEALSEAMLEHVIAIRKRELPRNHNDTGEAVGVLAGVLARSGRAAEAEARLRQTVADLEEVFPEDGFQVAFARSMLGENLALQGRYEDAEPLLLDGHEVLLAVSEDPATFFPIDSYGRVIRLYDAWGRQESARPFRLALAELLATAHWPVAWTFSSVILGPDEEDLTSRIERFDSLLGGYSFAVDPGNVDAAELLGEIDGLVDSVAANLPDGDPRTRAIGRSFLVWTHALGPGEMRRRLLEETLRILDPWAETVPLDTAEAHATLTLESTSGDAHASLDRALELMQLFTESDAWYTANLKARIGRALLERGRTSEAESILEESLEVLGVQLGPTNRDYQAVKRLLERARSASE